MMRWKKKIEWKNIVSWKNIIFWDKTEKNKVQVETGAENNRCWNLVRKVKRKIAPMICMAVCGVILHAGVSYAHQQLLQQGIAEEVLRFQAVKLLVRDAVLRWVNAELDNQEEKNEDCNLEYADGSENSEQESSEQESSKQENRESERRITFLKKKNEEEKAVENIELTEKAESGEKTEMERFLYAYLSEIEKVADDVLLQNGFTYKSTARIETCYFPDRTYGDCTFPAGWYKALRICLGEANGHNWWCVLYPKLCFTDCLHAVVEEEQIEELEEVLTVEEYESLLQQPGKWKIAFKWF